MGDGTRRHGRELRLELPPRDGLRHLYGGDVARVATQGPGAISRRARARRCIAAWGADRDAAIDSNGAAALRVARLRGRGALRGVGVAVTLARCGPRRLARVQADP